MPTIFDTDTRVRLLGRIERLSPNTHRQWGKMSPAEMQVHIGDGLRIALGRRFSTRQPRVAAPRLIVQSLKRCSQASTIGATFDGNRCLPASR